MNNDERQDIISGLMDADLELCEKKGHDYSGNKDCMANLRLFGFLGVVVRLGDKFMRLKSFTEQGELKVKDESIRDTLRDMRIYAYLAEILLDEEEETRDANMEMPEDVSNTLDSKSEKFSPLDRSVK